ncbi:MAG: fimbrillin family protein [Proteiniphilum sp.]|nr:fimbrillin family protein [Proteiniphilum sp.]
MKTKTNLKQLSLVVISSLFLNACEGGGIISWDSPKQIQVNAVIEKVKTRATSTAWDNGDAIGIYMKPTGQSLNNTNSLADNIRYVTDGTGAFVAANLDSTICFPENGDDVDFIAYYPKKDNITDFIYPVDLNNQSIQSEIDLMFADNVVGRNFMTPDIDLVFKHKLSKINVNFSGTDQAMDLTGLDAWITGMGTKADFSLADGTLSAPAAVGDIHFNVSPDGKGGQAIVLPTNILAGCSLVIALDNNTYTYAMDGSELITSFAPSTRSTYNITLNPKDKVAVVTGGTIIDWLEGPAENIEIGKDVPMKDEVDPEGDGTELYPYTVEQAKLIPGTDSVWVQGYIVGSIDALDSSVVAFGIEGGDGKSLVIASSSSETNESNCMAINLNLSDNVPVLNLIDNPGNLGKKTKFFGKISPTSSIKFANLYYIIEYDSKFITP